MKRGARRLACCLAATMLLLAASGVARALPVQLDRTEFEALTSGDLTTIVDDFERFSAGFQNNPLTLLNGTVTFAASGPNIPGNSPFCTAGDCLAGTTGGGTRTFDAFPAGTQLWGTDFAAFGSTDIFDITVVGGSGMLILDDVAPGDFFGFQDPMGLTSVTFENVSIDGQSNYVFDNVTTAVPEPSSALLVGLGLVWVAARRRG